MFSFARPRRMPAATPSALPPSALPSFSPRSSTPASSILLSSFICTLIVLLLAPPRPSFAQAGSDNAGSAATVREAANGTDTAGGAVPAALETVLESRNRVALELGGKPVSLTMTIRSFASGRRLRGEISFVLRGEEPPPPTDDLTCAASLSFGCGVVANFSMPRRKPDAPAVFESEVEDGVVWIRSDRNKRGSDAASDDFEQFVAGIVEHPRVAVRVRVDQRQDFNFDLRNLPWPLADFSDDHPVTRRFKDDPVLAGLRKRFPSRYLKVFNVARQVAPEAGALSPEAETRILESMHAAVGGLRPMVPDELLEKIVMNAVTASRQVGSKDVALCNALAVAAKSAVATPQLADSGVAKEAYELWRQVVEQAHPRFVRRVPNEELQASSDRFEENVRRANETGCGMFAAVTEAMLKLPPAERRLWLRATVGTMEDIRAEPRPAPR